MTWIITSIDTCEKNYYNNTLIVENYNSFMKTRNSQDRATTILINGKTDLLVDTLINETVYLNYNTIKYAGKQRSIYDTIGEIFIKILEGGHKFSEIIVRIYVNGINKLTGNYNQTVINDLYNVINGHCNLQLIISDISIFNKQVLLTTNSILSILGESP